MVAKSNIYKKLPLSLRNALKYGYGFVPLKYRLGKKFFKQLDFLEKSQWWSKQELENYQNEELRKLIKHAYDNVPYYNRTFKENNLVVSDIKTINDLHKIPFLTSDIVRKNPDDFIDKNYNKRDLKIITTSGTSGKVLRVYFDPRKECINGNPIEWRFYRWAGYDLEDVCGVFRTHFLKNNQLRDGHFYIYNPIQKNVLFASYNIEDKNISNYMKAFIDYPIKFIQGYPTPIKMFVDMLRKKNIKSKLSIQAVFTLAEMLLPEQRKTIEEYFNCPIFDWYGMEERAVLACECEQHAGHHINSEVSIMEFEKTPYGSEIIGTGLTNHVMPFIRYRTGDYGELIPEKCKCGRGLPLMKLMGGRKRSFIIDSLGVQKYIIGTLDSFSGKIRQYQYIQRDKGVVEILIVKSSQNASVSKGDVIKQMEYEAGKNFKFKITFVKEIKPTSGGKVPLVVGLGEL